MGYAEELTDRRVEQKNIFARKIFSDILEILLPTDRTRGRAGPVSSHESRMSPSLRHPRLRKMRFSSSLVTRVPALAQPLLRVDSALLNRCVRRHVLALRNTVATRSTSAVLPATNRCRCVNHLGALQSRNLRSGSKSLAEVTLRY